VDQPGARPRPARPPRQRLRHGDGAGQRPGRPRARAEGRPTARLPQLADPADRAHVAAVWGWTPTTCRCPAAAPSSCSTPSAPTAGAHAAGARLQRRASPRPTPGG
jgi:hypothetical protein